MRASAGLRGLNARGGGSMLSADNRAVVLITGAASGIGKSTSIALARRGDHVILTDIDEVQLDEVAREISDSGGHAVAIAADMGSRDSISRMFDEIDERFARLDFAVNNAGIEGEQIATADYSEGGWERVIAINLTGVWHCMRFEIPLMLRHGRGVIVNISSVAGLVGFQGSAAYVASKHGMNGLTKTAALDYAQSGIRVNAICPGGIETPMVDRAMHGDAENRRNLIAMHPMGRIGTPEEVAETILWLCSDASTFITGQTIAIDGGFTAR
jgi:NAD(P)-dependent dehydrogenase (short-subunit alcohol dehydrogenase family)